MRSSRPKDTAEQILKRQWVVLQQKVTAERASIEHGAFPPGHPIGTRHIPRETRQQRLIRWEEALRKLEGEMNAAKID